MKTRLENQIAIVTGSSSGNGQAIALALSSAGATVICTDLNKNARKEGYEVPRISALKRYPNWLVIFGNRQRQRRSVRCGLFSFFSTQAL
jgi:NAD(P)-dependent dehydrogenase (short-subunit alcohol dehydrogenase family)